MHLFPKLTHLIIPVNFDLTYVPETVKSIVYFDVYPYDNIDIKKYINLTKLN